VYSSIPCISKYIFLSQSVPLFSIANNISNRTSINNINEIASFNQSIRNYVIDTNASMKEYVEQGKPPLFTLGQNGSTVVLTTNLKNALGNTSDVKHESINITGRLNQRATLYIGNGSIFYNGSNICINAC